MQLSIHTCCAQALRETLVQNKPFSFEVQLVILQYNMMHGDVPDMLIREQPLGSSLGALEGFDAGHSKRDTATHETTLFCISTVSVKQEAVFHPSHCSCKPRVKREQRSPDEQKYL